MLCCILNSSRNLLFIFFISSRNLLFIFFIAAISIKKIWQNFAICKKKGFATASPNSQVKQHLIQLSNLIRCMIQLPTAQVMPFCQRGSPDLAIAIIAFCLGLIPFLIDSGILKIQPFQISLLESSDHSEHSQGIQRGGNI